MRDLTDALWKAVDTLEEHGLPYAVMGGLAVRVYGVPRPTYDVDFTVSINRESLPGFYASIEEAGFQVPEQYRSGWVDQVAGLPLVKFQLLHRGEKIDVDIFLAETPFLKSVLERRELEKVEGRDVYVVTAEDLILLKLIAHRPRDLIDIADVRFTQGELDEAYLREWAISLRIADRLEDVLKQSPF